MAEFPALPLWTDSYLADTRHLSTLEHGAYLLLLMEAWRRPRCSLPDNDTLLARLAGLDPSVWAQIKPAVMAFWVLDARAREWTQKRLLKEREYVRENSAKQRAKAKSRWSKTKNTDAVAMPQGMPQGMPNACRSDAPTPTPTPTPDEGKKAPIGAKKKPPGGGPITAANFPDWVPAEAAAGWLAFRRAKRAPVTQRVFDLLVKDLEAVRAAGYDPGAALDHAVQRSWQGFKAEWVLRDFAAGANNRSGRHADDLFAEKMAVARSIDQRTKAHGGMADDAGGSAAAAIPDARRKPGS